MRLCGREYQIKWELSQGFVCLKMVDAQGEGEATDRDHPVKGPNQSKWRKGKEYQM